MMRITTGHIDDERIVSEGISMKHINMFAIAYKDRLGKGFSETEPWITNDLENNLMKYKIKANELIRAGYRDVFIFKYSDPVPESITWDYVKKHEI